MKADNIGNITISSDISERDLGDEIIIIKAGRDELHTFKDTGMEIWRMLKDGKTLPEILGKITEDYEIERSKASADLTEFLADCKIRGLINY